MLNQCNFIGRTGQEIELKYTTSGTAVVNVSLAVSEKFKDKAGNRQEKTEWVKLVAWGKTAEIMGQYVKKGDLIHVTGKLQTRSYEQNGEKKYVSEIVISQMQMLGSKGDDQQHNQRQPEPAQAQEATPPPAYGQPTMPGVNTSDPSPRGDYGGGADTPGSIPF